MYKLTLLWLRTFADGVCDVSIGTFSGHTWVVSCKQLFVINAAPIAQILVQGNFEKKYKQHFFVDSSIPLWNFRYQTVYIRVLDLIQVIILHVTRFRCIDNIHLYMCRYLKVCDQGNELFTMKPYTTCKHVNRWWRFIKYMSIHYHDWLHADICYIWLTTFILVLSARVLIWLTNLVEYKQCT